MTGMSQWRKAWRLLRENCHLTHHQVRAIFGEHLGGLAYHRNLIHTELKADEQSWMSEANTLALLLNNEDVEVFISALRQALWVEGEPQFSLTVVRLVEKMVREWNGWGEVERQQIKDRILRRLTNWEKRTGLEAWTERHLLTYLHINGIAT